jgi:aconitate hydratase
LERFGKPGKTLLGSDSHTCTGGALGMIAIGAGGLDVAIAMAGGLYYLPRPKVMRINLKNQLPDWVSAKDVILQILSVMSTKGNVGYVIEYGGEGVQNLEIPDRATITNMGAELGVTTSIFPSDQKTRDYLKAQGRENDWIPLEADLDAIYDRVMEIDMAKLTPLVASPHSPANVYPITKIAKLTVNQVIIGSCTNSSYMDLMIVANSLKNQKVAPHVDAHLAPGSKQVLQMISDNGALSQIINAGFRIMESACGFCIGAGVSPPSNGVSVRTNNRNYFGRAGTESAGVYLVSPESAVACAIKGIITDPRSLNIPYSRPKLPMNFTIDNSMILEPTNDPNISIIRGPNIGDPPMTPSFKEEINGECIIKLGDKITTDDIAPAGDRIKYRSNIPKYALFTFELIDPKFVETALQNKKQNIDNIIVGGESYGQGSSREHAAMCPMYLGVRVVIAKSFERIHRANLINFGVIPLLFVNPEDYMKIEKSDQIRIPNLRAIRSEKSFKLENLTNKSAITLKIDLSIRERDIILAGGLLSYTRSKLKK